VKAVDGIISPWFIGFVLFAAMPLVLSLLMSMTAASRGSISRGA